MTTFCPHCNEEVSADELRDADDGWLCYGCESLAPDDADECPVCGLSREASEHFSGDDE